MELIDTHTHPFDEAFDVDRAEVVARACEAGVRRMMCPAIDAATHAALFGLCDAYPDVCLPMMGLHPTSVNDNPDWRREVALVEEYLSGGVSRRFYAVGEVGLDFYWSREWQREQEEAFRRQVEFSLRFGLPLVIHTREAWPEMLGRLVALPPYLPPVPYRGKRNEPAYIVHVCRKVAELKGIAPEEVAAATSANACRMFGI